MCLEEEEEKPFLVYMLIRCSFDQQSHKYMTRCMKCSWRSYWLMRPPKLNLSGFDVLAVKTKISQKQSVLYLSFELGGIMHSFVKATSTWGNIKKVTSTRYIHALIHNPTKRQWNIMGRSAQLCSSTMIPNKYGNPIYCFMYDRIWVFGCRIYVWMKWTLCYKSFGRNVQYIYICPIHIILFNPTSIDETIPIPYIYIVNQILIKNAHGIVWAMLSTLVPHFATYAT